ncbi:MAG: DNA-protecting protein DprA [Rubellimicrobium sp.]|nr:DNA-protecting protein DprA [Rubellimicrobium sp.]
MTGRKSSSTHPPLPPTQEEDRLLRLRLLRSRRVGIATFWRLLAEHGSAAAALDALPGLARSAGIDDYTPCPEGVAAAELARGRAAGARLIAPGDSAYPAQLATIADAPPLLWLRSGGAVTGRPMIALVGARNASSLGVRMTRALATDLGRGGHVVVSGLARGIDAAAHEASLATGTVAVMAGGVDVVYPPEHAALAQRILASGGALLSEQPPGTVPQARHFPARNRIVSGMARAVVVVEAATRSGSLITARTALDQGREVMAVPGHPLDPRAGGCNLLLRDGATLVRDAADVVEALGRIAGPDAPEAAAGPPPVAPPQEQTRTAAPPDPDEPAPRPARTLGRIAALHRQILDRLGPVPVPEDQLIRDLEAPARLVAPVLTELELEGRIHRAPGGRLARLS